MNSYLPKPLRDRFRLLRIPVPTIDDLQALCRGIVADLVPRQRQRSGVVSAARSRRARRRGAALERRQRAPPARRGEPADREARRHAEALMEKPLIARAMLAEDFPAAFRLVWEVAGSPADVDLTDLKELSGRAPDRMLFGLAREICRDKAVEAVRAGKRDLAEAWRLLSAPPEGHRWRTPEGHWIFSRVLIALARAIDADPTLLDDDSFCEAVVGWRFLDKAGSDGEEDLIVCAKSHGAALKVDKGDLRVWAKRPMEEWKWREASLAMAQRRRDPGHPHTTSRTSTSSAVCRRTWSTGALRWGSR